MWRSGFDRQPIVLTMTAFVVQSSLLLTSTVLVHSVQNNVPSQSLSSGIKRLPDIYWNSSNPIFRVDNHDHIIDVNQGRSSNNYFSEYDQVNILCPQYDKSTTPNIEDTERFVIYHVNREEYEMCRVMTAHPKVVGVCSRPYTKSFYTISFRSFSPSPGVLEFQPGQDYYFMTTSSKEDLHLRSGGMCRTHNMKVVFKVADSALQNSVTPVRAPPVKPLQQDNQLYTPAPPSLQNEVSDDSKETLEERRTRRKKDRRRNKKEKLASSQLITTVVPPYGSELSPYLNDNPQFRQKEPSEVERVNNLMAQKDSIFSAGGSAAPKVTSSITSIFIILLLFIAL